MIIIRHKAVEHLEDYSQIKSLGQKVGPFTYNEDPFYAGPPQLDFHIEPFLFTIYDDDENICDGFMILKLWSYY
jgi:hypothetical protein